MTNCAHREPVICSVYGLNAGFNPSHRPRPRRHGNKRPLLGGRGSDLHYSDNGRQSVSFTLSTLLPSRRPEGLACTGVLPKSQSTSKDMSVYKKLCVSLAAFCDLSVRQGIAYVPGDLILRSGVFLDVAFIQMTKASTFVQGKYIHGFQPVLLTSCCFIIPVNTHFYTLI